MQAFFNLNPAHFGRPRFQNPAHFACPRFLNPALFECPHFLGLAFVVPGSMCLSLVQKTKLKFMESSKQKLFGSNLTKRFEKALADFQLTHWPYEDDLLYMHMLWPLLQTLDY